MFAEEIARTGVSLSPGMMTQRRGLLIQGGDVAKEMLIRDSYDPRRMERVIHAFLRESYSTDVYEHTHFISIFMTKRTVDVCKGEQPRDHNPVPSSCCASAAGPAATCPSPQTPTRRRRVTHREPEKTAELRAVIIFDLSTS